MKLTWINFLHIYQPPTQSSEIVLKVIHESYELILVLLEKYSDFKTTLNIGGSLIELFEKNNRVDILEKFKVFVEKGQVELVGSAMYHPILALLPDDHIRRQIKLNTEILKKYFGDTITLQGFFIPEMAYSKRVADIIAKCGFSWLVLDGVHFEHQSELPNPSIKYSIKDNGLNVVFRNRKFSKTFPPEYIILNKNSIKDDYIIIAHDGELYGHWHTDDKGYYEKAFANPDIEMKLVSNYLKDLQQTKEITLVEASWESLTDELESNIPYGLWDAPKNKIHKNLWAFAERVIDIVAQQTTDPQYVLAEKHLDKGLASCAWWWASEKIPAAFSPLTWNPTEIEKGAQELLNAIRSLKNLDMHTRMELEKMYTALRELIWQHHWELQALKKV